MSETAELFDMLRLHYYEQTSPPLDDHRLSFGEFIVDELGKRGMCLITAGVTGTESETYTIEEGQ